MNTDRFSDSIRRKLESIRPDFSEKNWVRMQATLQQATPPLSGLPTGYQHPANGAWSAQSWLLAAAAVSTVVLVSLAIWQRNQISDLRRTVSQLSKPQTTIQPRRLPTETTAPNAVPLPLATQTVRRGGPAANRLNQSADRSANPVTVSRPDTVYITRYVAVPTKTASPAPDRTAQRLADAPNGSQISRFEQGRSLADAQSQQRKATRSAATERSENVANNTSPFAIGTTNETTNAVNNRPESVNPPTRRTDEKTALQSGNLPESTVNVLGGTKRLPAPEATDNPASTERATAVPAGFADAGVSGETGQPAVTYALATSQPLTMEAIDWSNVLARQAKRMRPVRTTTVGGQAVPASQPVTQPVGQVAVGFRIGVGAEVSRTVRSGGVLTELLIGKHLTLGAGFGWASFAGGTFLTDVEFDRGKPKKFRRDYIPGRGIDPRSDILNIKTHTVQVQIPISFGYRIPVSQTVSLLPSVGTTLSLRGRELVTFTYRQPLRNFETASYRVPRPVDLRNNLTFGAAVEWKRSHWIGQVGPVLTVPTVADTHWHEGPSVGLRARVFYQF